VAGNEATAQNKRENEEDQSRLGSLIQEVQEAIEERAVLNE
jgi:hypothetical protein